MNEQKREQLQAEALDAYLTDLQSGRGAPYEDAARPGGVPADQAALLNALVDLAEANAPDAGFASRLEAELRDASARALARQEVAARRPRPGNAAAAIAAALERMSNVNRRLVLSLAGAAVLAMVLFAALALLNPNGPGAGPAQSTTRQVAQAPTSTSTPAPTTAPTHTPLSPAMTPTATAAQETPLPTATSTEAPLPPTATPAPSEPIVLPPLARWQETGGYGGGGMGGPLPVIKTFVLGVALPEGPERMPLYLQRDPAQVTAADAAEMAARLGVHGPVYQSLRAYVDELAGEPDPDNLPARGYLAVDGAREVMFEYAGIVRYNDRNRTSFVDGHWREPGEMPALEQAMQTAEAFLRSANLLEGEFETAASGDTIVFYRVLGGEWPLTEPVARVNIWTDGQVGQVHYWPLELDALAEVPILSATEAWDILRANQPDERVWQYPYHRAEAPPWGEWQHQNPTFWARSYVTGQQAHRFGVPRAWFPTQDTPEGAPGGAPFLAVGDLVLAGDVQSLAEYILDLYVKEEWMYVHVWGEVEDAGEIRVLRLEGWEPAEETYWMGTVRRQGDQATLVTEDGRTIQLPDLPADIADGMQVSVSGGQEGDRLEWHLIQEMSYAESPPEQRAAETQLTVEQVDLVYLALPPNVLPPERWAELSSRAVQPVWRFRGHSDEGTAFEYYVQAVTGTYVESRPQ